MSVIPGKLIVDARSGDLGHLVEAELTGGYLDTHDMMNEVCRDCERTPSQATEFECEWADQGTAATLGDEVEDLQNENHRLRSFVVEAHKERDEARAQRDALASLDRLSDDGGDDENHD